MSDFEHETDFEKFKSYFDPIVKELYSRMDQITELLHSKKTDDVLDKVVESVEVDDTPPVPKVELVYKKVKNDKLYTKFHNKIWSNKVSYSYRLGEVQSDVQEAWNSTVNDYKTGAKKKTAKVSLKEIHANMKSNKRVASKGQMVHKVDKGFGFVSSVVAEHRKHFTTEDDKDTYMGMDLFMKDKVYEMYKDNKEKFEKKSVPSVVKLMQTAVMKVWSPVLGLYDFMTDWDDTDSKKRIVLDPLTPDEIEEWRSKGKSERDESSDADETVSSVKDDVVVDNSSVHSESEHEVVSEPVVTPKKKTRKRRRTGRGRKPVPVLSSDTE